MRLSSCTLCDHSQISVLNDGNSVIPPPEGLEEGTETHLNEDLHLELAKALLGDFEYEKDDGNWGIEVYCEAVIKMENVLQSNDIDMP